MYSLGQYEASCYGTELTHTYSLLFLFLAVGWGLSQTYSMSLIVIHWVVTRAAINLYTKRDAPSAVESLCPPG